MLYSAGPRSRSSLPHSLRAAALACADVTPITVSALLRCYLLATHFGGLPPDFRSLSTTFVAEVDFQAYR